MPTATVTRSIVVGGIQFGPQIPITNGELVQLSTVIPAAGVDVQRALNLKAAKIHALYIGSDQAIDIYTNAIHSGAPANHFQLAAGVPILWISGDAPLQDNTPTALADITTIYVGNAGANDANLDIIAIVDPTP
jgi:hypothetical protein